MASWYVVPAIRQMFREANEFAPERDRSADGTIGDAAHAGRVSDHNPDPDGSVDAGDLTDDPEHGCDVNVLWEQIRQRRDRRVRYAIHAGRWFWGWAGEARGYVPWRWYLYSGQNRHDRHGHMSVEDAYEHDVTPWWGRVGELDMDATAVTAAVLEALRQFGREPDGSNALSRVDASTDLLPTILDLLAAVNERLDVIEAKLDA